MQRHSISDDVWFVLVMIGAIHGPVMWYVIYWFSESKQIATVFVIAWYAVGILAGLAYNRIAADHWPEWENALTFAQRRILSFLLILSYGPLVCLSQKRRNELIYGRSHQSSAPDTAPKGSDE